jgi:hypothetical protein
MADVLVVFIFDQTNDEFRHYFVVLLCKTSWSWSPGRWSSRSWFCRIALRDSSFLYLDLCSGRRRRGTLRRHLERLELIAE